MKCVLLLFFNLIHFHLKIITFTNNDAEKFGVTLDINLVDRYLSTSQQLANLPPLLNFL